MPVTRTDFTANIRLNPGERTSPSIQIPAGITKIGLAIERAGLTAADGGLESLHIYVDVSTDDGQTWIEIGGVGTKPGDVYDRQGVLRVETTCLIRLPRPLIGAVLLARARAWVNAVYTGYIKAVLCDDPIPSPPTVKHNSVAYDNDSEGGGTAASSLTISSFAVGNNADRAMVVGVANWDNTLANSVVTAVTFNGSGTGWAQEGTEYGPGSTYDRVAIWGKTAPTVTTASVVITFASTCDEFSANVLSAYNVDQSDSFYGWAVDEGTDTTASTSVSPTNAGDMVYDVLYTWNSGNFLTLTPGGTQTKRCDYDIAGTEYDTTGVSTAPGTVSSMTWTIPTAGEYVQAAIIIKEALGEPSAAITGTATETIDEDDIVAGGKTIVITLTYDTFIAE